VLRTQLSPFCIQQNAVSYFLFLSSHHPNNSFENISIYHLPLFNSVAKTLFHARKITEGRSIYPPPKKKKNYSYGFAHV
jgi:hypothetical protein